MLLLLLVTTETSTVSETELSLTAKSANSAFPPTYIKAPFGLKRAVQGNPYSCRCPGRVGAERQNKAEKTVFGHWGWEGCLCGGRMEGCRDSHQSGEIWGSRQTVRPLETEVEV